MAPEAVRLSDLACEGTPAIPEAYRAFRGATAPRFFFAPGCLPDAAPLSRIVGPDGKERTIAIADDYARGRFLYYSRHVFNLGRPVNWLLNPFTGGRHHARTHWCDYPTFSAKLGDIKDVWEPSRFACAFWLVRAYALTQDERYPETFWEFFESWAEQNPPNMGPNWKCGQETALRTMAWCFALYGLWNARATTPDRIVALVKLIAIQADRIAGNISYAVSQKNNHGLSEAVGLITVGLLFPEFRGARRWLELGRSVMEKEVLRQIYVDGSYVQQSMNYHRVMLHDCLWAIRLAELNGQPFSNELTHRVAAAGEFLFQMLDVESGCVPNYGANDGALVLPLSPCGYPDYRPTIQAERYQALGRRVLKEGPWDEMLLWLYGPEALAIDPVAAAPVSSRFDGGGYYTLRDGDSWCMIRCHSYRDRVGHVDMLHLDLWHKGVNVLGDSGTYKYFVPDSPLLERYFKDIAAHNTVEIDRRGPLELASRFLWLPWPKARCLDHLPGRWVGEHLAYDRPPWNVLPRRTVTIAGERTWVITDELLGSGRHNVALRWHLADGPFELDAGGRRMSIDLPCSRVRLEIEAPETLRTAVRRGERQGDTAAGWVSNYYGECAPRPTLEVAGDCSLPVRLVTRILLEGYNAG